MHSHDLLRISIDLASVNARRPRRTELCRAVSSTYYALFHCLARSCADALAGRQGKTSIRAAWLQAYRALDHGEARKRRQQGSAIRGYPAAVRNFTEQFVKMQVMRHTADYHPDFSFDRQEVMDVIDETRDVIDGFLKTPIKDRRAFSVYLLTKVRPA